MIVIVLVSLFPIKSELIICSMSELCCGGGSLAL